MEENKVNAPENHEKQVKRPSRFGFVRDVLAGFVMGIAFIIPGFSGGSVAAIMGVYDKIIGAIADLFSSFKKSFFTLLPIGIGVVGGAIAFLFPLEWALGAFPFPTVSLFVGLAVGGMVSVSDKIKWKFTFGNILTFVLPFLLSLAFCFIPEEAAMQQDLFNLAAFDYAILFAVGFVAALALVVPGISGSMFLLVLGYYDPIVDMITNHFLKGQDMLIATLVLGCMGIGIVVGFFLISKVMKFLLARFPNYVYIAIVGIIIGSVPSVFVSTAKDAGMTTLESLPGNPWHWVICVLLLALGFTLAFMFARFAGKPSSGAVCEVEEITPEVEYFEEGELDEEFFEEGYAAYTDYGADGMGAQTENDGATRVGDTEEHPVNQSELDTADVSDAVTDATDNVDEGGKA